MAEGTATRPHEAASRNGDGKAVAGGWTRLDNATIEGAAAVGSVAFHVYVVLAMHADQGGECFPSANRLANLCGVSKRTVWRALATLETHGWIAKDNRQEKTGDHTSNLYTLLPRQASDRKAPPTHATSDKDAPGTSDKNAPGLVTKAHHEQEPKNKTQLNQTQGNGFALPFSSQRFIQTWGDFVEHRRGLKPPLTPLAIKRTLAKCQTWGEEAAIQALDDSIENGWKGIFPPKNGIDTRNGNSNGSPRRHAPDPIIEL